MNILSITPDLIKEKKVTFKPATEEETETKNDEDLLKLEAELLETPLDQVLPKKKDELESIEKRYEKLYALKKENLSSKSKICQQDVHRKMFNDAFVNLLKNQVYFLIKLFNDK